MIIENAERFGLSQLHQLRGRVGRGAEQSYCILVTNYKLTEDTRKRLEIMVRTNDGFEIAEADLKLRGPGDLEGTQQSGIAFDLKIADIVRDGQLLQYVRAIIWSGSIVTGFLGCVLVRVGIGVHLDKILIGCIMLTIPGIPLPTRCGICCWAEHHRSVSFVESLLIAASIAGGFLLATVLAEGVL